ncbi:MAG: hypothetical protein WAO20_13755 [Acidobacteriota bacterium]
MELERTQGYRQGLKDLADDAPVFDEGHDLQLMFAARTVQRVHLIDLFDPVLSIHPSGQPLGGPVLDLSVVLLRFSNNGAEKGLWLSGCELPNIHFNTGDGRLGRSLE